MNANQREEYGVRKPRLRNLLKHGFSTPKSVEAWLQNSKTALWSAQAMLAPIRCASPITLKHDFSTPKPPYGVREPRLRRVLGRENRPRMKPE